MMSLQHERIDPSPLPCWRMRTGRVWSGFVSQVLLFVMFFVMGQALIAPDATAFVNEPDGFKDMRWGGASGTLFSKDDFVGFNSDDKSTKYQRISDVNPVEVDSVRLFGAVFSYYNGKFWKVDLEARLLQAGKLLDLFIGKYGEPSQITHLSEFSREYTWSGAGTDIVLVASLNFYDRKTPDIVTATLYSKKIKSTIDADTVSITTDKKLPVDAVNGFRGRKWGSGFNKTVTYLPLEQEPFYTYLIKGDDMVFEGVNAQEIRYRFHNNTALQKVELFFSGRQNYLKVKDACFRLFGQTSQYEHGEIRWIGKKTTVGLSFSVDSQGVWQTRLNYFGFGSQ